jgi:hypothetical protein
MEALSSRTSCIHQGEQAFVGMDRDLTIFGRQRDGDGQNKLQINGSKDSSWYIINRMNLIQS